jgi:hypothetical protein
MAVNANIAAKAKRSAPAHESASFQRPESDCPDEQPGDHHHNQLCHGSKLVLYRPWLEHGPSVLNEVVSPVLADAIARGTGRLERCELSHPYLHLAPLVTTA